MEARGFGIRHSHTPTAKGKKAKDSTNLMNKSVQRFPAMWGMSVTLYPLGEEGGGAISSPLFSLPPKPRM